MTRRQDNARRRRGNRGIVPKADETRASELENEVISAVVVLYILICAGLLLVHYAQPWLTQLGLADATLRGMA